MSRRLHRLLRRFLPKRFRAAWGVDMEEAFLEALAEARARGWPATAAIWTREVADIMRTGRRLRSEARRYGAGFVGRRARRNEGGKMGTVGLDDVRYAIRSLVRKPTLTLFAMMTIALGVGATTAMFSTVEGVILNPVPYENGDRMVGLFRRMGGGSAFITPGPDQVAAWAEHTDVFERVERWTGQSYTLTGRGDPVELQAARIRPSYHDVIGVHPLMGRTFQESEFAGSGARVALVGQGFAERTFGSATAALGATLDLNGEPWAVIGVMPAGTLVPGWGLRKVDVWTPFSDDLADRQSPALGLLREGTTIEMVRERLSAIPTGEDGFGDGYASLVSEQVGQGIRGYLGLLMGAVVLLLLIACVNVSNLLLFRAEARKRETAVRAAMGGSRGRLTRQLLVESLLLALAGGTLGIAFALVGQAGILRLRPDQLEVLDRVSINLPVLAFALAITLLAGVVFGLVPAIQAGGRHALTPLRSGVRSHGDVIGSRLRWFLVSGEVALSFALLIGSLTVLSTLVERQRVDFGYEIDEVVIVQTTAPRWKFETAEERTELYGGLAERMRAIPGVVGATHASGAPPSAGILFGEVEVQGRGPLDGTHVMHGPYVREDYFETLGQPVLSGRVFTRVDLAGEERLAVLGASTARFFFGAEDPVGSWFAVGGGEERYTVIGVVPDVPMTGLSATREILQVYHPMRSAGNNASLVLRLDADAEAGPAIALAREIIRDVEPELRVNRIAEGRVFQRETLEREQFATTIMAVFAGFALLLAAVGLYGVVSQVVGQRTREIGIRMALGAKHSTIAGMVLRRAGGATLAGIVIGVVLAIGAVRFIESQVFQATSEDWPTFVLAAFALTFTALLAAYGPARRAARVDPVASMRVE